jgi:hypothetical protein
MARHADAQAGAEYGADVIGEPGRHLQQPPVPGPLPRHRRLEQVPGTVQLMRGCEVSKARAGRLDLEPGVEVAVGCLSRPHQVDHLVGQRPQHLRVAVLAAAAQLPADRLQPLVGVRINEVLALVLIGSSARRNELEICQGPRPLQALVPRRLTDHPVHELATSPEAFGQSEFRRRERCQPEVRGREISGYRGTARGDDWPALHGPTSHLVSFRDHAQRAPSLPG